MACASCAAKIETAVRRIDGVADVAVSVTTGTLTISHGDSFPATQMKRQVTGLGYGIADDAEPALSRPRAAEAGTDRWWSTRKTVLTLACGGALAVAFGLAKYSLG